VVDLLAAHQIGALVVSTDGRTIEGIISERDIVSALRSRGGDALEAVVADAMSTAVHTCEPDDETEHLMELMTNHRVRHIPVVAQGELAGIVSIGDVVKTRISELEFERRALVDYITTGR
jgi:CBS domain-containing protein